MRNKGQLVHCLVCGYEWRTYSTVLPKKCANPKCRSPRWFRRKLTCWNKGLTKDTDARMAKLSELRRGKRRPEIAGENHPNYGKPLSVETRERIGLSRKGKYNGSDNPFYGRSHSVETVEKIRVALRGYWTQERRDTWSVKQRNHQVTKFKPIKQPRVKSSLGRRPMLPKITVECRVCGKPIVCSAYYPSVYCSRECHAASRQGMRYPDEWRAKMSANHPDCSGERNGRWLGGVSSEPYGIEFTDALRDEIRGRDDYTCQLCGTKENGRALPVHHIDYTKTHNDKGNLVSLCDSCHGRTNSNRDYYQAYLQLVVLKEIPNANIRL